MSRVSHWSSANLSIRWKPRGGVRTFATTLCLQQPCQRALPLPSESCKWEWFGAGRHFDVMRPDGVTQGLRRQPDLMVTVCRTQFQSATSCFKPPCVWIFKETLLWSVSCGEGIITRIAARGASLNVWSLSHKSVSVEGLLCGGGNTRSAAFAAWSLSRGFQCVEGSHLHPANGIGSHRVNVPAIPVAT